MVVAEAKKKSDVDIGWARAWFRSYQAHRCGSSPAFVLLATPEKLYLWKDQTADAPAEPTAVTDAHRIFASYLQRSNLEPSRVAGRTFEFVVGSWLNDLSQHLWQPSAPDEIHALVETGLVDAIENGRVVADIAA